MFLSVRILLQFKILGSQVPTHTHAFKKTKVRNARDASLAFFMVRF